MAGIGDTLDKYLGKTFSFLGKVLKFIKWTLIIIGVAISTYICYILFGYLFYVGFFVCMPVFLFLFNKILDAPSQIFIECQIGSEEGKEEKTKTDRIGILKIPYKKIESMEKEGGNISKIDSISGKPLSIVERVDLQKNVIKKAWIDEVQSLEFYARKEAFYDLQKKFINIIRKVMVLLANWKIYNALEQKETYERIDYTTDIKELEKKFKSESIDDIIK